MKQYTVKIEAVKKKFQLLDPYKAISGALFLSFWMVPI